MPEWVQKGVPSLRFEQHIYASDDQGWVNVNGRDRYQGDMISQELQLKEILPQQVILKYRGEVFSLPSLAIIEAWSNDSAVPQSTHVSSPTVNSVALPSLT